MEVNRNYLYSHKMTIGVGLIIILFWMLWPLMHEFAKSHGTL